MDEKARQDSTAERMLGLGGAVLDRGALDGLLQRVVHLACRAIHGASDVSITVRDNGGYRTSNVTGSTALAIDEAQYAADGGPCLEGIRTAQQLHASVGAIDERWPVVAERARDLGIAGVLSTPLMVDAHRVLGALNVYTADEDPFGDEDRSTAALLSEHAAILLDNAIALMSATRLNEQLRQAVASGEIIGEAKGILMERESCTRDEAFDMLRRASQRENRKLRDLAEALVLRVEARRQERRGT